MSDVKLSVLHSLQKEFSALYLKYYGINHGQILASNWNSSHWLKNQINHINDQIGNVKDLISSRESDRRYHKLISDALNNDPGLRKWADSLQRDRDYYMSTRQRNVA